MSENIYEGVYNLIASNAEIDKEIGGRVWPHVAPLVKEEGGVTVDYPFVVYTKETIITHDALWEQVNATTDTFNITIFDVNFQQCARVAQLIRNEIDQHWGPDGGIEFQLVRYSDEESQFFEDIRAYGIIQEYEIFWNLN